MTQEIPMQTREKIKSIDILDIFKETKNSGKRIALAVEGGGLRGVVSAAMLALFEDLGLVDQIDSVSGTSAGAINLAYFLNKDMKSGLNLYKSLASPRFIQPMAWPNAMNLNYLFEDQIPHHFPLPWEALRTHPIHYYISVTEVSTGRGQWLKAQDAKSDGELISYLRASASAPLFTTNKENISGKSYNDGQVEFSIPYHIFQKEHADVIFCLLTRPRHYQKKKSFPSQLFERLALRGYSAEYKQSFFNITDNYNNDLETVFNSPHIIPLALEPEDYIVSKMTKNPDDIQRCVDAVYKRFT